MVERGERGQGPQEAGMEVSRGGLALGVALAIGVGCAAQVKPTPTGLPDRSEAACVRQARASLGQAESAFACRGLLHESGGALVGAIKGSREGSFKLFGVDEKGGVGAQVETAHKGGRLALVASEGGVIAVSAEGSVVRVSAHATGLGGESPATELSVEVGQVLDFEVVAAEGGALIAAATGHGLQIWRVDGRGAQVATSMALKHPEMPYCNKVGLALTEGGAASATLRCQEVVPLAPEVAGGAAAIKDFDYDATEPAATDLILTITAGGVEVSAASAAASGPEGEPARYGLKQRLHQELPRAAGERVNLLDGVELGGERIVSLACVGPDEGPIEVDLSVVRCQGP